MDPGDLEAVHEIADVEDVVRGHVGARPGELALAGDHVGVDDERHVALLLIEGEDDALADDHPALELVQEPSREHAQRFEHEF